MVTRDVTRVTVVAEIPDNIGWIIRLLRKTERTRTKVRNIAYMEFPPLISKRSGIFMLYCHIKCILIYN